MNKTLDSFPDLRINQFVVPKGSKLKLIEELHKVGINDHTLFPDLNGLGTYLHWKIFDRFPE
jgi:hypothetical protein